MDRNGLTLKLHVRDLIRFVGCRLPAIANDEVNIRVSLVVVPAGSVPRLEVHGQAINFSLEPASAPLCSTLRQPARRPGLPTTRGCEQIHQVFRQNFHVSIFPRLSQKERKLLGQEKGWVDGTLLSSYPSEYKEGRVGNLRMIMMGLSVAKGMYCKFRSIVLVGLDGEIRDTHRA